MGSRSTPADRWISRNVWSETSRMSASISVPGGTSTLVISDTRSVSNIGDGTNQAAGIVIGGPGTASGALDHGIIENNGDVGLAFEGTNAATNFFVSNSVIWNNGFKGIAVIGLNPNTIILWNVAVSNHFSLALDANGPGAVVRITKSVITGNDVGMNPLNGAQLISGGDNFVDGNRATSRRLPPSG